MQIKTLLLISFLLLSVTNLSAQNKSATLSGSTKDKTTKLALPFVNVGSSAILFTILMVLITVAYVKKQ